MEARLLTLERTHRGHVEWIMTNSPGIPLSTDQLKETPETLLNSDHAKVFLYVWLTDILFRSQERFSVASTARGATWTEW